MYWKILLSNTLLNWYVRFDDTSLPNNVLQSYLGHYCEVHNLFITIVGNSSNENMYITRVINRLVNNNAKRDIYNRMNMTHVTKAVETVYQPLKAVDQSCLSRLYDLEMRERQTNLRESSNEWSILHENIVVLFTPLLTILVWRYDIMSCQTPDEMGCLIVHRFDD